MNEAQKPVSLRQSGIVLRSLENFDHVVGDGDHSVAPVGVVPESLDQKAAEDDVRLELRVADRLRRLHRLVEKDLAPGELTDLGHDFGEIGQELDAARVALRQEVDCTAKQVRCSRHVTAGEGSAPGRPELRRPPAAELEAVVV